MSILIAGYYGFGNAGDELILLSLIERFRQEDPGCSIGVLSNHPARTAESHGVKAVHRWRPWAWIFPMLNAKRFVLGGGGLLQEISGPWNYAYYLTLVLLAKVLGCRTEIIAIGVDPIKGRLNRFWTRWILNHWTDALSVRDELSREALVSAGVNRPIRIQEDPVSQLALAKGNLKSEKIAVALSPSRTGIPRPGDVARFCTRVAEKCSVEIDLLVFFPKEDEALARSVALATQAVRSVRVVLDPKALLAWVPEYKLMISSRYHALVLAKSAGIPFIGWGTQLKTVSLCLLSKAPYTNTDHSWNEEVLFSQITQFLPQTDAYGIKDKSVILTPRTD